MDIQNKQAVSSLKAIVADMKKNINIEQNLFDLTRAIENMDQQIENSEGMPNVEDITNSCTFVKCILLELKVQILEKNHLDFDKIEKQIQNLLSE